MYDRVLLGLGPFRFRVTRHAYEELARRCGGEWVSQGRIGRRPASQFVHTAESEITITATIYPELTGGLAQVDAMAEAAEAGTVMMMVDGTGRVLGRWYISEITDTASFLMADGTPRKVEVEITLGRYGEDGTGFGGLLG